MDQGPAHSWFGQLRRDGWLFAVVATLLLVLNVLPATHLQAGTVAVICTVDGATSDGGEPGAEPNCPICLTSASCFGSIATLGADNAGAMPWPRSTSDQMRSKAAAGPPKSDRHGTDHIRGPPFV